MSDFAKTIEAKSDQLNAIDLISGPITVKITDVKVNLSAEQQPVSISFAGDNGKPWKPSKTMRRVLIIKWGDDETKFIGRHITLYRDSTVTWAGDAVGGVAISHMSDIGNEDRFLLTSSRGKNKQVRIERIKIKTPEEQAEDRKNKASAWLSQSKLEISELDSADLIDRWGSDNAAKIASLSKYDDLISELTEFIVSSKGDFEQEKGAK